MPARLLRFDILWLNGRDLRELSLVERKKILRKSIPRKSNSVGCVSYVDKDAVKLLSATLKEEHAADSKLNKLAEGKLNKQAA